MTRRTATLVVLAAAVVLAGCTGAPIGDAGSPTETVDGDGPSDDGRVNFYLSDQPNAIDDFRHLNVTVTSVGFHRGGENGSWVERDVDNRTVDLTELQGDRATQIDSFDLPNGTYTKVFVYVSDTNGTLNETGEQVEVKLPSERLHLNVQFTLNGSDEVDFVYDISVHRAGNSGTYILRPVVSESGTDVPIEAVDDEEPEEEEPEETETEEPAETDDEESETPESTEAETSEPTETAETETESTQTDTPESTATQTPTAEPA